MAATCCPSASSSLQGIVGASSTLLLLRSSVLHLYYYLLALVGLAIYVVNQRPVFLKQCWLLLVEECKVGYALLSLKKAVEEVEQQRFRQLLSEDSLETDVGERIYVFCHISLFDGKDNLFC